MSTLLDVILFGGTGMVGRAVLRECLREARVLVIGRSSAGVVHPKLRELLRADLANDGAPLNVVVVRRREAQEIPQ